MSYHTLPKRRIYRSSVWLVTFGDLLTLMLCFFIAAISLQSRKTLTPVLPSNRNNSQTSPTQGPPKEITPAGTMLAAVSVEESDSPQALPERVVQRVVISEGSFQRGGAKPAESAKRRLRNAVTARGYVMQRAVVHACARKAQSTGAEADALSVERGLQVRGQLIDIGVPRDLVRLQALGAACAGLPRHAAETDAVVIEIFQARTRHG